MKKRMVLLLAVLLMLVGCGNSSASAGAQQTVEPANETVNEGQADVSESASKDTTVEQTETVEAVEDENTAVAETESSSDTLVIYFSRTGEQYVVGVIDKGNTAIVAEMIAEKTGADLFEVIPEDDHYPMTYDELTDVAKREQNENARPAYSGELPDLSGYSTIFIGSPVWWGDWPMIMYTVFENNDFSGKTILPLCTNEGSGMGSSEREIKKTCPGADVKRGLPVTGSTAANSKSSVERWLKANGMI